MRGKDIPRDFPQRAQLFPDLEEWYNPGDSVIVSPSGRIVAGPPHEEHRILYAECDPVVASTAKRPLDVAGAPPRAVHLHPHGHPRRPPSHHIREPWRPP